MAHSASSAPVGANHHRQVFQGEGGPLLTLRARWPRPEGEGRAERRIARYYEHLARRWLERWSGPLLERAKGAQGQGWQAEMDFTGTHWGDGLLSLYLDLTETTSGRPRVVRLGDVWELTRGTPVTLSALLGRPKQWRGQALEQVKRQVERRVESGEYIYYEDWPRLCQRWFSPERYYLTQDGPVVFYPMETIAPALEGIPAFLLSPPQGQEVPAAGGT